MFVLIMICTLYIISIMSPEYSHCRSHFLGVTPDVAGGFCTWPDFDGAAGQGDVPSGGEPAILEHLKPYLGKHGIYIYIMDMYVYIYIMDMYIYI